MINNFFTCRAGVLKRKLINLVEIAQKSWIENIVEDDSNAIESSQLHACMQMMSHMHSCVAAPYPKNNNQMITSKKNNQMMWRNLCALGGMLGRSIDELISYLPHSHHCLHWTRTPTMTIIVGQNFKQKWLSLGAEGVLLMLFPTAKSKRINPRPNTLSCLTIVSNS